MHVFRCGVRITGLLALMAVFPTTGAQVPAADLVLDGGKIYTVDQPHSVAEALAIRDGKIVFTGSSNDSKQWIGPSTKVEHLGGRLVLPGLFDSHIHPLGIVPIKVCDLNSGEKTLRELSAFVQACVAQFKVPDGGWLSVHQWNFSNGNQPDANSRHCESRSTMRPRPSRFSYSATTLTTVPSTVPHSRERRTTKEL